MRGSRRKLVAGLVGVSLTVASMMFLGQPAGAVSPVPITCTAAGTLEVVTGLEHTNWELAGVGSCQGDLEGAYVLGNLLVQGTSDSMGLCNQDGVVTNLSMSAKGTLVNLANPMLSKTLAGQTWGSPLTTYPVSTPFTISDSGGNPIGAGNIESRIFGKCPLVGGTPVMTVQFSFLT